MPIPWSPREWSVEAGGDIREETEVCAPYKGLDLKCQHRWRDLLLGICWDTLMFIENTSLC